MAAYRCDPLKRSPLGGHFPEARLSGPRCERGRRLLAAETVKSERAIDEQAATGETENV